MNTVFAVSLAALLASSTAVLAQQGGDRGNAGANAPAAEGAAGGAGGQSPSAREQAPGQTKGAGSARDQAPGQSDERGSSARTDAPGQNKDASDRSAGDRKDRKGEGAGDDDRKADRKMNDDDRDGKKAERMDGKDKAERTGDKDKSNRTDENAGGADTKAAARDVSPEQKTKVTTVFKNHRVEPARNIQFSLNVGTSVPRDVRFYAMPEDIVVIVPQYRGYRYFLVDDKIVIVDPNSYEIVDIIDV